jgi:recombination protein RecR
MSPLERIQQQLKQLPGIGYRSAERIAMHLLIEKPEQLRPLIAALEDAARSIRRCIRCGNVAGGDLCPICLDEKRDQRAICVVEHVPDLIAVERSSAWRGVYHVLHGRLSPLQGAGPESLNLAGLISRLAAGEVDELILALSNDVEGEATCHYISQHLPAGSSTKVTRIGFGLPSGGGVLYADAVTLKSALDGRRTYS